MKSTIILKKDGNSLYINPTTLLSKKAILVKGEYCFENLLEPVKNKKQEINEIKEPIHQLINKLTFREHTQILDIAMNQLKRSKTIKDLKKVKNTLATAYRYIQKNEGHQIYDGDLIYCDFVNAFKKDPNTAYTIMIKKLAKNHYVQIIDRLPEEKINEILYQKVTNNKYDELITEIDYFPIESLENGMYNFCKKVFDTAILEVIQEKKKHYCGEDCANFCHCSKVFDSPKKPINEYEFIYDGIEKINSRKNIDYFLVHNCENYVLTKDRRSKLNIIPYKYNNFLK